MFKNIKSLIYEKKSILCPAEYFELDINEDISILKYTDSMNNDKIESIEDKLIMEYFDELFRIIYGWKNKYEDNNVIDGIEWKLQITYKNQEVKMFHGKNAFPNNFGYLDKIKNEIIKK